MRRFFPLILLVFVLVVYFALNPRPTNLFQHYVLLADSFIKGHFDIVNKPWHYGDFIMFNGKHYFQYGPVPAFILIPLVLVFKTSISQTYISMLIGALNTVLMLKLLEKIGLKNANTRILLAIFFAFGTVHFSASATGTTWFFQHIVALFFMLLALIENFGKRRPMLLGFLFSLAVFSRQPVIFSLPFFLLFLKKGVTYMEFFRKFLLFALGALPMFAFSVYYNFSRFGNILDDGRYGMYLSYINNTFPYTYKRQEDPAFTTNMLDLSNIPLNLYTMFLMLPDFSAKPPFVTPSPYGMSVLITSPLLIWCLFAKRNFMVAASWIAVILIATANFLWFSQGWVQFGYRYLLDFLPFLMIILSYSLSRFTKLEITVLLWCILINAWGANYLKV